MNNGFIAEHRAVPQVIRGVLIAVPVLLLFVILFSSADLVFQHYVAGLFSFNVNGELVWRIFWILAVALGFFGLSALISRHHETEPASHQSEPARRSALVEVTVLLGSLNALFLIFIFIQLAYLFGGAANVVAGGFTYAEYARKGFFELIAVAGLSFLLIFVAERLLLREGQRHSMQFKVLSSALIVQVLIVLVSAFKRLNLYEGAYGYTSLRLTSHIFILWLAVVFLALLYKIYADKRESAMAMYMFVSVIALFVSFNLINVDGMVVRKNLDRYQVTHKLDVRYMHTLSDDALPQMVVLLDSSDPKLKQTMAQYLFWRRQDLLVSDKHWQSANMTRISALRTLNAHKALLDQNRDTLIDPSYRGPGHD